MPGGEVGRGLLHPIPLVALVVLVINDHVLKRAYPGVITGKLSDFAGLALFPLVLQGMYELALVITRRPWRPSPRVLLHCSILTGIVFISIKTWTPALDAWRYSLAALQWPVREVWAMVSGRMLPPLIPVQAVRDPSDLVALPSLALAWWAGRRRT